MIKYIQRNFPIILIALFIIGAIASLAHGVGGGVNATFESVTITGITPGLCPQISLTGKLVGIACNNGSGNNVQPGGSSGSIQYNSASNFAGLTGNGLTQVNGSSAPTVIPLPLAQNLGGTNTASPAPIPGPNISIVGTWPNQTFTALPIHEHTLVESAGVATMVTNNAIAGAIDDEIVPLSANITIFTDVAANMAVGQIVHVHVTTSGTAWTVGFGNGTGVTLADSISGSNGTVGSACQPPATGWADYWFWYDGANLILFNCSPYANACTGTQPLSAGAATVTSSCFTTTSNMLCVENTTFNQVSCTPGNGTLTIVGTGSDVIRWTRLF